MPRPEAAWPVVEALFSRDLPEDAQPFDTNLFASPATQCVPYPPPALVPLYLNEIDILDDEEIVYIRSEFFDAERVVYMDGRDHPDAGERTSLGHSIGRWDGDVLEVDTTLFADYPAIRLGRNRHLIERFELSEDGRRVVLDFTIEDPDFFVEPFSGSIEWAYAPDLEMLRYDCDPNVATQFLPASGGDE